MYSDETILKLLDEQFNWKGTVRQLPNYVRNDLWGGVNGHDIVAALRYVNADVTTLLQYSYPLERLVERKFIAVFDKKKFSTTETEPLRTWI